MELNHTGILSELFLSLNYLRSVRPEAQVVDALLVLVPVVDLVNPSGDGAHG